MAFKVVRKYNAIWFADPAGDGYGFFQLLLDDGSRVDTRNYSASDLSAIIGVLSNGGKLLYNDEKNSFVSESFNP